MGRRAAAVALSLVLVLPACGGERATAVKLDGSPRYPDDEGVVTAISFERLTLDGKRTYGVSKNLRAFSTYTRELEPMLSRDGQYVQLGIDDKKVVWMAGVAGVVPTKPPAVYYVGGLTRIDGEHRAVFEDGTVLRLASGVRRPAGNGRVRAKIDPARHVVVELVPA